MGQYWKIINLDKREFLHPHTFKDGLKLMEFAPSSEGTMTALAILLTDTNSNGSGSGDLDSNDPIVGHWFGDRIAIVGDYGDNGGPYITKEDCEGLKDSEGKPVKGPSKVNLYHLASQKYTDISMDILFAMLDDKELLNTYSKLSDNTWGMSYSELIKLKKTKRQDWPTLIGSFKDEQVNAFFERKLKESPK